MRKIIFTFLALFMMSMTSNAATQEWESGDCICTLTDDGVFTVSKKSGEGDGKMADYEYANEVPWYSHGTNDITSVIIGNGVTSIGKNAFYGFKKITSATIPDDVTNIGIYAFGWCSGLTVVNIGNSVERISDEAFLKCSDLAAVICQAKTPPTVGNDLFSGCPSYITIYVPDDAVTAYKSEDAETKGWTQAYKDLIAPLPTNCFCITAEEEITGICFNAAGIMIYSTDNGTNWNNLPESGEGGISLSKDQKMYVMAKTIQTTSGGRFVIPGTASVSGDVRTLLKPKDPESAETGSRAFNVLFKDCKITSAKDLIIPGTTPSYQCYAYMFQDCKNLTEAPALPAMTMFENCCEGMFQGCTSLTTAPALPATTLGYCCYWEMFKGCTKLTSAPVLPATTLADGCYYGMFNGCVNLSSAPVLPATELAVACYAYMFSGCTKLNYVKCLATNIDANTYTPDWLANVAPSGTFVRDINTSWPTNSASGIPTGWTPEDARFPSVTLNGAGYATYSSAADINISTTDVKAYKAAVDGTTITLTELNGYIPAGTGVLLYKESGAGTKVTFQAGTGDAADVTGNDLKPTTTTTKDVVDKPIGEQIWALGNGNKFLKYTGASFISNRAYLTTAPLSAKEMIIDFEGETTGINTVDNSQCIIHNSQLYNLQGVRVNNNYKGIVIVNGKKYIKR